MAEKKEIKCAACGATELKVINGRIRKCEYCGREQVIDDTVNGEILNYINNGNISRNRGDFDKAESYFKEALDKDKDNIDAFWGLLLCDYGIMHEKDPETGAYKPTCNRLSKDSFRSNEYYLKLSKLAKGKEESDVYEKQIDELEKIRSTIVVLAEKEQAYDVFICYKKTQSLDDVRSEERTEDSVKARDIYDVLEKEGYKVFYAEKTLQAGTLYEPVIYTALSTAKVMIMVCSNRKYIESTWVKNEWVRFLKQRERDNNKTIIPVFMSSFTANELPDKLSKFQGLNLDSVTFSIDLLNTVSKKCERSLVKSTLKRNDVVINNKYTIKPLATVQIEKRVFGGAKEKLVISSTEKSLFKQADMLLGMKKFKKASTIYDTITSQNDAQYTAWLGKLRCQLEDDVSVNALRVCIDKTNFEKYLSQAPEEEALQFLQSFIAFVRVNAVKPTVVEAIIILYDELLKWLDDANDAELSLSLYKAAILILANNRKLLYKPICKLMEASCKVIPSNKVNVFIERNLEMGNNLRTRGYFKEAAEFYQKILDVNDHQVAALWGKELALHKCRSEEFIPNMESGFPEVMEKILSTGYDKTEYFEILFKTVEKLFLRAQDKKASSALEKISSLIPKVLNEYYINTFIHFGDLLLLKKNFKMAKKYYTQVLGENDKNGLAHWGMFKIDRKVRTELELLLSRKDFVGETNYQNAVNSVQDDDNIFLDFYEKWDLLKRRGQGKLRKFISKVNDEIVISKEVITIENLIVDGGFNDLLESYEDIGKYNKNPAYFKREAFRLTLASFSEKDKKDYLDEYDSYNGVTTSSGKNTKSKTKAVKYVAQKKTNAYGHPILKYLLFMILGILTAFFGSRYLLRLEFIQDVFLYKEWIVILLCYIIGLFIWKIGRKTFKIRIRQIDQYGNSIEYKSKLRIVLAIICWYTYFEIMIMTILLAAEGLL